MNFEYPLFLLLYIPFAALLFYIVKRPLPSLRIPSVKPFQAACKTGKFTRSSIPFLLYAIAITALILALARPRKGLEEIKQRAEGIDIMLAIDLSGSMASIDVPQNIDTEGSLRSALKSGNLKNRLETAKQEIKRFIERRPNDRIGLVGFAPLPYNICPPTLDHAWLIANMERLEPGVIGDQTGIAGPVATAVQRLKDSESKRRVLVLFTDGSNNVNAKITPRQAAKLASTFDVIIYTVGIGSPRAFVLQNTFAGEQFIPIEQQFDEKLLQDMASASSGKYYKAADAEGLEKVMSEIDKLEKTTAEQPRMIDYREFAPPLISFSLALLLLAFVLEHSIFIRLP